MKEVKELITTVKKKRRLEIARVKGHSGITGNELADCLAKQGGTATTAGPAPFLPIPPATSKRILAEFWDKEWQTEWKKYPHAKHTKLIIPKVGRWRNTVKLTNLLSQEELCLLIQVVSGHGLFRGHVGHWKEELDPTCTLCGEDAETALHLWTECPALELERLQALQRGGDKVFQLLDLFRSNKVTRLMNSVLDSDEVEE